MVTEPRLDPDCRGGNHGGCVGPPGTTCECLCHAEPGQELAQRQEQQRAEWREAVAGLHRHQRTHRARRREPEISGVVVPPPTLPLDGER